VIEIHTGRYADATDMAEQKSELKRVQMAAEFAASLGMTVNAGHGLNYHNVQAVASIPQLSELNIGHAIMGRAIFVGLEQAIQDMRRLMLEVR